MWGRLVEGAQKADAITKRYSQRSGFKETGPEGLGREVGGSEDKELVGLCI